MSCSSWCIVFPHITLISAKIPLLIFSARKRLSRPAQASDQLGTEYASLNSFPPFDQLGTEYASPNSFPPFDQLGTEYASLNSFPQ